MASVFHKLGPFEILREIGRGGMAVVFLAQDTRNDSRVALKLVPQGTDREAHEILEAEQWGAELQKQFCQISPHVPFVYEHGLESGYFYVAMEYLDGENLSDLDQPRTRSRRTRCDDWRRVVPLPRRCAPFRGHGRRATASPPVAR